MTDPFFSFQINLFIFQNLCDFLKFFLRLSKSITVQLLVQSPGKFVYMIWNLSTKTYPKFVTSRSLLRIFKFFFKNVNKIEKIQIDSKKSVNSFETKKRYVT